MRQAILLFLFYLLSSLYLSTINFKTKFVSRMEYSWICSSEMLVLYESNLRNGFSELKKLAMRWRFSSKSSPFSKFVKYNMKFSLLNILYRCFYNIAFNITLRLDAKIADISCFRCYLRMLIFFSSSFEENYISIYSKNILIYSVFFAS